MLCSMMSHTLPGALSCFCEIADRIGGRTPVVFLDYDGTLTPIVEHPEDAVLSPSMRQVVQRLAEKCAVAIISGRDLDDVRLRVGLENIFYAGSHGFDIAGPAGFHVRHQAGEAYVPALDALEVALGDALCDLPGVQIERKRYAVAVHYRRVAEDQVPRVEAAVDWCLAKHRELRKTHGKKVFDIQPAIDWHKGRAVEWLLEAIGLDRAASFALYLGDDLTDEDAFAAVGRSLTGTGILVVDPAQPRETAAEFGLPCVNEVAMFLDRLTDAVRNS